MKNFQTDIYDFITSGLCGRYSQFTVDFLQDQLTCINPDKDFILSRIYRVDRIISIMDKDIPDYKFFKELQKFLTGIATEIYNEERYMKGVLDLWKNYND